VRDIIVNKEGKMEGIVTAEKVQARCPECGEIVETISYDGQVKGYCSVTRKVVEAQIVISN
jgi:hypothetical protein